MLEIAYASMDEILISKNMLANKLYLDRFWIDLIIERGIIIIKQDIKQNELFPHNKLLSK
jgi:hypothetical protein